MDVRNLGREDELKVLVEANKCTKTTVKKLEIVNSIYEQYSSIQIELVRKKVGRGLPNELRKKIRKSSF